MADTIYLRLNDFQPTPVAGEVLLWEKKSGVLAYNNTNRRITLPQLKDYKVIVKIGTRFTSVNGYISFKVFDNTAGTNIGSIGELFAADPENVADHRTLNNIKFQTNVILNSEAADHDISVIVVDQLDCEGILADLSYCYVEEF